jgi:spoIIIJ-associated protein
MPMVRRPPDPYVNSHSRPVTIELDPMNAEERRVVHLALADDGDVRTESVGEGEDRRVCIVPVEDDEPDDRGNVDPGAKTDAGA